MAGVATRGTADSFLKDAHINRMRRAATSVNEARRELFTKKNCAFDRLPLTEYALLQHEATTLKPQHEATTLKLQRRAGSFCDVDAQAEGLVQRVAHALKLVCHAFAHVPVSRSDK